MSFLDYYYEGLIIKKRKFNQKQQKYIQEERVLLNQNSKPNKSFQNTPLRAANRHIKAKLNCLIKISYLPSFDEGRFYEKVRGTIALCYFSFFYTCWRVLWNMKLSCFKDNIQYALLTVHPYKKVQYINKTRY